MIYCYFVLNAAEQEFIGQVICVCSTNRFNRGVDLQIDECNKLKY